MEVRKYNSKDKQEVISLWKECGLVAIQNDSAKDIERKLKAVESIGISKTHLFVANDNINAQQFYESLGWFPRDEVRMYSFNASENLNI